MAAMTRLEIVSMALGQRFGEGDRSFLNLCLDQRYRELWDQARWDFRFTTPVAFTATANQHQQDLGSLVDPDAGGTLNVMRVDKVFNDVEEELDAVSQDEFWRSFPIYTTPAPTAQQGVATCWSWLPAWEPDGTRNERLLLGPAPDSADVFYLVLERQFVDLTDDTYPMIPPQYHGGLVIGLLELATKLRGDKTWKNYEGEWERVVLEMLDNHQLQAAPFRYERDPL